MSEKREKITLLERAAKRFQGRAERETGGGDERCSFCGKAKNEVGRLIAGPSVLICNECIAECNRILDR